MFPRTTRCQVGDQLLEVCGINMRLANYDQVANIIHQCGESISMLVQYNPDSECARDASLRLFCVSGRLDFVSRAFFFPFFFFFLFDTRAPTPFVLNVSTEFTGSDRSLAEESLTRPDSWAQVQHGRRRQRRQRVSDAVQLAQERRPSAADPVCRAPACRGRWRRERRRRRWRCVDVGELDAPCAAFDERREVEEHDDDDRGRQRRVQQREQHADEPRDTGSTAQLSCPPVSAAGATTRRRGPVAAEEQRGTSRPPRAASEVGRVE